MAEEIDALEEPFASLLAAYDESLANGSSNVLSTPPRELTSLSDRLDRAQNCLAKLEGIWPRGGSSISGETVAARRAAEEAAANGVALAALPKEFGRFQIERELGRGGYGIVFLATDPLLKRKVALKVPRPDVLITPDLRNRFLREAQAAAVLDHPNIIPIYETGVIGPACYLAAPYCEGPTLSEWIRKRTSPVPLREAASIALKLAEAVQHAHDRQILHRDLKPANVLMEPLRRGTNASFGETAATLQPRLTDFGLAKVVEDQGDDTRSGAILGTPRYMSPEQAEGRTKAIGPATDVYALGAILYEMLVSRPPHFGANDRETLHFVRTVEPTPPSSVRADVSRDLEAICLKCLEKEPHRRYATAQLLAEDLRRFLSGRPTLARPLQLHDRGLRWARREPMGAAFVATCLLAVLSLSATCVWYTFQIQAAVELASRLGRGAVEREQDLQSRVGATDLRLALFEWRQGDVGAAKRRLGRLAAFKDGDRPADFARRLLQRRLESRAAAPMDPWPPELEPTPAPLVSDAPICSVVCSTAGNFLATLDEKGIVRGGRQDGPSGWKLETAAGKSAVLVLSAEQTHLGVFETGVGLRMIIDAGGEMIWVRPNTPDPQPVVSAAFSFRLAEAARSPVLHIYEALMDGRFSSWSDGDALPTNLGKIGARARRIVLAPNAEQLVVAADDGSLAVWHTRNWTQAATLQASGEKIFHSLAVSGDGRWIVAGDSQGRVEWWDLRRGSKRSINLKSKAMALDIGLDGATLLVSQPAGRIDLYHLRSGEFLWALDHPPVDAQACYFGATGDLLHILSLNAGRCEFRSFD